MKYSKKILRKVGKIPKAYILLFLLVSVYFIGFSATTLNEYNRFWYGNFDLGIPDQGIWLLSRFQEPYLTTRGLHLFGDHASYIHLFVAPLYWLWDDVKALILLHTFVLAIGAIPVYLIARDKFENDWIPLLFSLSYLLLPAVHYSNLDQGYHYESFTVPLILFGWWFLTNGRTKLFYITVFFSLICKEEIAITFILYGVYIAVKGKWRIGCITTISSLLYLLVVMFILLPYFNDDGAFYSGRTIGSFGKTPSEKIISATNISFMHSKLDTEENRVYIEKLLSPVGYLVLLDPLGILASGSLWLNMIQDWTYAHDIQYHYVTPIIPFIYISIINGIGRARKRRKIQAILLIVLFTATLLGNYYHSPDQSTLRDPYRMLNEVRNFDTMPAEHENVIQIMQMIPDNATVSATYQLVSHLTHRRGIYMFPNPFRANLYGIDEQGVHPDKDVDYVLFDLMVVEDEQRKHGSLSKVTESGKYKRIKKYKNIELWKKI